MVGPPIKIIWARRNYRQRSAKKITAPWAHLPYHILELISKRLRLCEFLNFRSVCKTWRAATKQCCNPYLVISYQRSEENSPYIISVRDCRSYNFRQPLFNQRYCIGSSHGWLIMRRNKPFESSLLNFFTGSHIKLPPWNLNEKFGQIYLSSAPTESKCTILAIGISLQGFAFCKPGDCEWTKGECNYPFYSSKGVKDYLQYAVALGGKFYALSYQGNLVLIDDVAHPRTLTVSSAVGKVRPLRPVKRYFQYLVESQGEMLVVLLDATRHGDVVDYVEVFRLDFPTKSWISIERLGDRILFVGFNCSFSVSANVMGCRGNYIYFVNHWIDAWGVFDMEYGRVINGHSKGGSWPTSYYNNRVWFLPALV